MRDARGAVKKNSTASAATPDGAVEQPPPIVRALLDARDEEIMLVDTRGGTLYLNAAARAARPQASTPSQLIARGGRAVSLRLGDTMFGEIIIVPQEPARTWADQERGAIRQTLQQTGGKRAETARRLGISRTTLWRRLKAERS
jgi:transcriptional regulator of acetoin/glycerol metabolism